MNGTYTTIGGKVYDLAQLQPVHAIFCEKMLAHFRMGTAYVEVDRMINTPVNPLLVETQGVITREIYNHPLYRIVRDVVDRLGIQQGYLGSSPNHHLDDPLADEWMTVAKAAELKGTTVPAIYDAIKRGDLVSTDKPVQVSRRSLENYEPSSKRQSAGKTPKKE